MHYYVILGRKVNRPNDTGKFKCVVCEGVTDVKRYELASLVTS